MGTVNADLTVRNRTRSVQIQKCVALTINTPRGQKEKKLLHTCVSGRNLNSNWNLIKLDAILISREWREECFSEKLRE